MLCMEGLFVDSKRLKDKEIKQQESNNTTSSNPIEGVNKIMPLNTKTSSSRLYGGYNNSFSKQSEINYAELIAAINSAFLITIIRL